MHRRTAPTTLTVSLLAMIVAGACGQQANTPARPAPSPAAPAESGEFKSADDLLAALERADADLVSLTADIRYDRTFELQGDRQVRTGKLYFVSGGSAGPAPQPGAAPKRGRQFAVAFQDLLVGNTYREEPKSYTFNGEWLVEKYPAEKPPLIIKRQVVPPGQTFDPLKIGEGPFPVPIGQKSADIVRRFDVVLLPGDAGLDPAPDAEAADKLASEKLKEFVRGAAHLKLVPKPQFAPDEEFTEVHLWYKRDSRGSLLPRMARTVDKQNNVSVVQLINVAVQRAGEARNEAAAVPPDVLDTSEPAGWNIQVVPWQKPAGSGAGPTKEGADAGDR
jgi:hypothetical protein